MTEEITYEIKAEVGMLSRDEKGNTKEINLISWNGAEPKYDIRKWNLKHDRCFKGITLNGEEARRLAFILMVEFPNEVKNFNKLRKENIDEEEKEEVNTDGEE